MSFRTRIIGAIALTLFVVGCSSRTAAPLQANEPIEQNINLRNRPAPAAPERNNIDTNDYLDHALNELDAVEQ